MALRPGDFKSPVSTKFHHPGNDLRAINGNITADPGIFPTTIQIVELPQCLGGEQQGTIRNKHRGFVSHYIL